jgi:hypothetical protein
VRYSAPAGSARRLERISPMPVFPRPHPTPSCVRCPPLSPLPATGTAAYPSTWR